ncbi:MAG: PAS domain-containing protein [Cytophagales bacterium]|nr:MAG: PAS domain-containing protein [Cytophagales bacterium]TAF61645.1 MAG: PAS domain-containing protein [Cytophagales bacterium]
MREHYALDIDSFEAPAQRVLVFKEKLYADVDRLMQFFFWGYALLGVVLSAFYNTWSKLILGGAVMVAYYISILLIKHLSTRRHLHALLLFVFVLQFIMQMKGAFYMHFMIFITMMVLVFYQNWRLVSTYTIAVAVYSLSFYTIINSGNPGLKELFLDVPNTDWQTMFFGLLMGGIQYVLASFFCVYLDKQTEKDAGHRIFLEEQVNLEENTAFARHIAEGQLDTEFYPSKHNVMGKALLEMRDNIREASQKEQALTWKTQGIAQAGQLMMDAETLEQLTSNVLIFCVKYMRGHQGVLFLVEKNNQNRSVLRIAASHALSDKSRNKLEFEVGEGLVGQVANSRKPLFLNSTPSHYFDIKSALGQAKPSSLIIVPLLLHDDLAGVLEISSFVAFDDTQQQFVLELSERLAASILAQRAAEENMQLLHNTQAYTEQLRSQEEEMRQNMEELQATQEELTKQMMQNELTRNELLARVEALNESALVSEFLLDGKMIYANKKFANTYKQRNADLRNTSIFRYLSIEDSPAEIANIRERLLQKQIFQAVFKCQLANQEDIWLETTLAPVLDENSEVSKCINISFDITKQVAQGMRLSKLLKEADQASRAMKEAHQLVDEKLEAIDNSIGMMEIKNDGTILSVNSRFLSILRYEEVDLVGQSHKILIPTDELLFSNYKNFLRKLLLEGSLEGEFKRLTKDGTFVWIRGCYTATLDLDNKISKIILLCYDITAEQLQRKALHENLAQIQQHEEEMRQNMEELQATQEELNRASMELNNFITALDNATIILELDKYGRVHRVNQNFSRVTGYSKSEAEGQPHSFYVPKEQNAAEDFAILWERINKGEYFESEVKRLKKNGNIIWFRVYYIPVKNEQGELQRIICISSDITSSKENTQKIPA